MSGILPSYMRSAISMGDMPFLPATTRSSDIDCEGGKVRMRSHKGVSWYNLLPKASRRDVDDPSKCG